SSQASARPAHRAKPADDHHAGREQGPEVGRHDDLSRSRDDRGDLDQWPGDLIGDGLNVKDTLGGRLTRNVGAYPETQARLISLSALHEPEPANPGSDEKN